MVMQTTCAFGDIYGTDESLSFGEEKAISHLSAELVSSNTPTTRIQVVKSIIEYRTRVSRDFVQVTLESGSKF